MVRVPCDMCNNVCINKISNSYAIKSVKWTYLCYNTMMIRVYLLGPSANTASKRETAEKHAPCHEFVCRLSNCERYTLIPIYILIGVKIETKHQKRDKIITIYYDVQLCSVQFSHSHARWEILARTLCRFLHFIGVCVCRDRETLHTRFLAQYACMIFHSEHSNVSKNHFRIFRPLRSFSFSTASTFSCTYRHKSFHL